MKGLPIKAIFAAIFCNILFGSAVPMIKFGYEHFNITTDVFSKILFAGIRFFISGIFVYLVDYARQKKLPRVSKGNRFNILLVALTYTFLQYIFNYVGLSNTNGATASVLVSTSAFISVILAHFVYKNDKLTFRKIIGCLIGFCGVAIACLWGEGIKSVSFLGEGFIIISAFCFVIGSIFNKKASQIDNSFSVTSWNLIIGGGLLILVGLIGYDGTMTVTIEGILILLYLIMVSSVGFTIWSNLLRKYSIGILGVFNFIIPLSGAIISSIILDDDILNWQYFISFVLISLGIIAVNYVPQKDRQKE